MRICEVAGCGKIHRAKGLCSGHYTNVKRFGDVTGRPWPTIEQLFWERASKNESDKCWTWKGCRHTDGYGQVHHKGRVYLAHRLAYQFVRGPIPAGLHIDHLCRNRGCCNPDHLEPVTCAENIRRGHEARGVLGKRHKTKRELATLEVEG